MNELKAIDVNNVNHNDLRKVLANYKKISNEREALRLVFLRSIDITKFKTWINSKSEYVCAYCDSPEYKIDISKDDKKIISGLVERVYGYRCSIAHAKGDVEEYIAIPSISKEKISGRDFIIADAEDEDGKFGSTTSDSIKAMITNDTTHILMNIIAFEEDENLERYIEYSKKLLERFADATIIDTKITKCK